MSQGLSFFSKKQKIVFSYTVWNNFYFFLGYPAINKTVLIHLAEDYHSVRSIHCCDLLPPQQ
ncbi:hypothetical protein HMPREF2792_01365 [Corynebacterium sp. HMSC068H04]|nr:hypothetical protein HMPREF2792_01365 [Corynebacterium sp. HMSC068H04]